MTSTYRLVENIDCSSAKEFCEAISPIGLIFSLFAPIETWVFRGHGSSRYPLLPSAFRQDGRRKLFQFARTGVEIPAGECRNLVQWSAEAAAIRHFLIRADQAGLAFPEDSQLTRRNLWQCIEVFDSLRREREKPNPDIRALTRPIPELNWIPTSLLSFVAVAQHYGIPTRLLDWTYSPFVAAYFAARDSLDGDAERFSVNALFASGLSVGHSLISVFQRKGLELNFASAPRAANPNLHAQEGVFTEFRWTHASPLDKWHPCAIDEALLGLENPEPQYAPLLFQITLGRNDAPEVLWYLDKLGYHAARLFPGFRGAALAVEEFGLMRPPGAP